MLQNADGDVFVIRRLDLGRRNATKLSERQDVLYYIKHLPLDYLLISWNLKPLSIRPFVVTPAKNRPNNVFFETVPDPLDTKNFLGNSERTKYVESHLGRKLKQVEIQTLIYTMLSFGYNRSWVRDANSDKRFKNIYNKICQSCRSEQATSVCGDCQSSFYCSEQCQKDDWKKSHSLECFSKQV